MAPYQAWLIHQLPFFTLASGNVSIHFSPPQKNRRNNMTKNMHYCNLNYTEPSPLLYYFSHKLKGRKEKEMMVKRRPFQNAEVTYHPATNCWKTTRKREISYRSNTYILQCVKPQPQSHSFCYYQYCTCNPYTLSHFERPDVQGGAPDLYGLWKMEIHPSCGSPISLAQPTSNYPPVSSSWVGQLLAELFSTCRLTWKCKAAWTHGQACCTLQSWLYQLAEKVAGGTEKKKSLQVI